MEKEEMKYEQAVRELEEIVERMENDELDIDQLSEQLKRAKTLVKLCKDINQNPMALNYRSSTYRLKSPYLSELELFPRHSYEVRKVKISFSFFCYGQ